MNRPPRVAASSPASLARHALLCIAMLLVAGPAPAAQGVCGMPQGAPANPADLAEAQSDLALAYYAEQPAGVVTCSMGYLAEKCGDHATALRIFDKCIARGYAGAMIWKGLMYENGNGLPQDDAKAAALFRQAAESGEGHYAALGKLHFASALHQGKGVPRDEAQARKWFEQAAAEGSADAAEFLRTGYHTGGRDAGGRGVGVPTEAVEGRALVRQQADAHAGAPWWQRVALAGILLGLMLLGMWRQQRPAGSASRRGRPGALVAGPQGATT